MPFLTVASGFAVSSAVELFPSERRWAVFCPSMSGNSVRVDFSTALNGTDASFGAFHPTADQPAVVASSTIRPAWGIFFPVTQWARVHLGTAATDTVSFQLVPFTAH